MAGGLPVRLTLSLLFVALLPGVAHAQEIIACDATADTTEARQLFEAGRAAAADQRWTEAEERMRRAWQLSCRPSALMNVGLALRSLGRAREARDVFRQVLSLEGLDDENRDRAQRYLNDVTAQVAALELTAIAPALRPEITLDGRALTDDGARPIRLETDPGAHSLVLRIEEHQPFLWNGDLSDGEVRRIAVEFDPIPVREVEDGFEYGWIILAIGLAAAIGTGIAVGVVLQNDAQLQPNSPDRFIVLGEN